MGWVATQARRAIAEEIKTMKGYAERTGNQPETEPGPISLRQVPVLAYGHAADEGRGAGYVWQPRHSRETRTGSPASVSGLVRRLMATERARILGREAIDLGRYTLEKRTQHWKESRKRFKQWVR